jgi:hypothetical protein
LVALEGVVGFETLESFTLGDYAQQVLWATKGRFNISDSMQCLSPQYVYRYLGIDQLFETDDKLVKDHVTCEYRKRLHRIWKSQLNSKNKIKATNALPWWCLF